MANRYARVFKVGNRRVYSTGAIADLFHVAPRTVSKWIDSGRLKGYRLPGSQDRRVTREALIAFTRESGMSTYELEVEFNLALRRVLLVGLTDQLAFQLIDLLPDEDQMRVESVQNVFDAGLLVREFEPDVVVVDLSIGRLDAQRIAGKVRGMRGNQVQVIALVGEDEAYFEELMAAGFGEVLAAPVDVACLARLIGGTNPDPIPEGDR